jgi:hypothetical protein
MRVAAVAGLNYPPGEKFRLKQVAAAAVEDLVPLAFQQLQTPEAEAEAEAKTYQQEPLIAAATAALAS